MSENLWRPRLESYLAVREAMGHSVRAERKLLLVSSWILSTKKAVSDRSVPNGLSIGLVCSRREAEWAARPDA